MHAHLVYQNPQNRKKIALKRDFLIEKMSIAEEREREGWGVQFWWWKIGKIKRKKENFLKKHFEGEVSIELFMHDRKGKKLF